MNLNEIPWNLNGFDLPDRERDESAAVLCAVCCVLCEVKCEKKRREEPKKHKSK